MIEGKNYVTLDWPLLCRQTNKMTMDRSAKNANLRDSMNVCAFFLGLKFNCERLWNTRNNFAVYYFGLHKIKS